MTFIHTPQATRYAFQFSQLPEDNKEPVSILDIFNTHKEWDMMTLQGKIAQLKDSESVGSPQKHLQLAQAMFTDPTGSIALGIWEDHISTVSIGKLYEMIHVQLKVWSGKKKISTT